MSEVKVFLEGIGEVSVPKGTTLREIVEKYYPDRKDEILGAVVNKDIKDFFYEVQEGDRIRPVTWQAPEGKHIFWHSSAHLLAEALESLYPGVKFGTGPAIENGFYYDVDLGDRTIGEKEIKQIEKKMLELARRKSPFKKRILSKQEAIEYYKKKGDPYKLEILEGIEDDVVSFYEHGNFVDLCRGPHLPHTGFIKAVKITNVAGAYWRGDPSKPQLTRIYGISFPTKEELKEYLRRLEEAKKRDHRVLGKQLGIFTFSQNVGSGLPLWLPNGAVLRKQLEDFLYREQVKRGYKFVYTPHIARKHLYEISGHFQKYHHHMFQPFTSPDETEEYILRPMNCPHHCEIYKSEPRSYRDLPLRLAEFGTVYRYEQSGELSGLLRVRGFTVDDAHIFCRPDQVLDEFKSVIDLVLFVFKKLGFEDFSAQISVRDPNNKEKYIGDDELWEQAEKSIQQAAEEMKLPARVMEGEAAFYGPKLDFMVRDALGREWQLGTIQVDYNLPQRFDLTYMGPDNKLHRPVMIHRAPFGSIERFVGVLIEHTEGKFPLWLAPIQVAILTISEKFVDYAKQVEQKLKDAGFRTLLDDSDEKINKKILKAEKQRIPYMAVIGQREAEEGTVAVRSRGRKQIGTMTVEEFIEFLKEQL
ncbi:MAG: threonine--tRNA ligase [Chlorobi bacterium]|nr:threonine--tRNA ligase [Chlorobiota bacterium]